MRIAFSSQLYTGPLRSCLIQSGRTEFRSDVLERRLQLPFEKALTFH